MKTQPVNPGSMPDNLRDHEFEIAAAWIAMGCTVGILGILIAALILGF